MFNTSHTFTYVGIELPFADDDFAARHIYTFKSPCGLRYLVYLEHYEYDMVAVKFFPKCLKASVSKRFSKLTNRHRPIGILGVCLQIMEFHLNKNPYNSFVIIATPTEEEKAAAGNLNKKWRIYSRIIGNFFSPVRFDHYRLKKKNAYILYNRDASHTITQTDAYLLKMLDRVG